MGYGEREAAVMGYGEREAADEQTAERRTATKSQRAEAVGATCVFGGSAEFYGSGAGAGLAPDGQMEAGACGALAGLAREFIPIRAGAKFRRDP